MELKVEWGVKGIFKADAVKVYREISSIGDDVSKEQIVEYARENVDSELHKCFEWDDAKAAESWRLQQAKLIVCNLKTNVAKDDESEPVYVRVFHQVENTNYVPLKVHVSDADSYQRLLAEAMRELRAFKEKYKNLVELKEIFDLIE